MKNINWRDLARGLLIGLIAGVGYLIAYKIIILFTEKTSWAKTMESLGWLIAIPVPAFLLNHFQKYMRKDEPIKPVEPLEDGDEEGDEAADGNEVDHTK